jgi:putative transposase
MGPGAESHHRRSTRLPEYDYASPGAYFVTVCAHARGCAFEEPEVRRAVEEVWGQIPGHFANVRLDEFIVMPNHVHGILWIVETSVVGAQHAAPLPASRAPRAKAGSLGAIVRSFKAAACKRVNEIRATRGTPLWQRNYYERVIRDGDELGRSREYILHNPLGWDFDGENTDRMANREYERQWSWLEGSGGGTACCAPTLPR